MSSTRRVAADPLFIIGSPRSGTSLLRLILTCHSEVVIPPECGFIVWLQEKYNSWCLVDSGDAVRLEEFVADLSQCRKFETWNLENAAVTNAIVSARPRSYSELCSCIYHHYATSLGKSVRFWGDKNNFYLHHLRRLSALYPGARFLHIVRDGRDVACSYREVVANPSTSPYAPRLPVKIEDIASEWSANVAKVAGFVEALPSWQRMTIRYEDLVTRPGQVVQQVCVWLMIRFEQGMLEFYSENSRGTLEPPATLDWKRRTLEPISPATVARYVTGLTEEEKTAFLDNAIAQLKRFGYVD